MAPKRRKQSDKLQQYSFSFYTFNQLPDGYRKTLFVPGNPHADAANGKLDSPAFKYLESLGAFFYRDQFSGRGILIDYPELDISTAKLTNFKAFWHSVTMETDNATFARVATWPNGRENKRYGDTYAWNMFNSLVTIEWINEVGVKHKKSEAISNIEALMKRFKEKK